jgi:hypothetical protein
LHRAKPGFPKAILISLALRAVVGQCVFGLRPPPLEVASGGGPYHLSRYTSVLMDPGAALTINQVTSPPYSGEFQRMAGDFLRLGTMREPFGCAFG